MLSTASAPEWHEPGTRRIVGYAGEPLTLLLVDDDPAQLRLLEQVLAPLGFVLLAARDGGSALTLAAGRHQDLVLLDISLPDMAGWEVARRLRARDGGHARIVMVSANAHEYAAGGDGEACHDAFVMKPVDIDVLLETIGGLLRLDWQYAQAAPPPRASLLPVARRLPPILIAHIEDLYQLGSIGHVRAIDSKLRDLVQADPQIEVFVSPLRAMISSFDITAYMAALETLRAGAAGGSNES